jgi:2'-5' RNA ligase
VLAGNGSSGAARLFLALDLPDAARRAIARWRDEVLAARHELRPVADAGLHVTLVFLGRHPSEEIERIWRVAAGALERLEAPSLVPSGCAWIPPRRSRLLSLELEDRGGRATAIHGALCGALAAAGLYEPEARPFWPHVTVARVRGRAKVRKGELTPAPRTAFGADGVTLYRSDLHPAGARYVALERLELPVSQG